MRMPLARSSACMTSATMARQVMASGPVASLAPQVSSGPSRSRRVRIRRLDMYAPAYPGGGGAGIAKAVEKEMSLPTTTGWARRDRDVKILMAHPLHRRLSQQGLAADLERQAPRVRLRPTRPAHPPGSTVPEGVFALRALLASQ